jgi:hypothetical protein
MVILIVVLLHPSSTICEEIINLMAKKVKELVGNK